MSALPPIRSSSPAAGGPRLAAVKEFKLPTAVLALDSHPDGKRLYAACFDGGIYEVALLTGEHRLLAKHASYASGVRFLPGANRVLSAGYDGALLWTDPAGGAPAMKVQAHRFWSWKMRVSADERLAASVTGQYTAGGYKYEPAAETEPSVKIFDAGSGKLLHALPHTPPTLSVAFSPDSRHIAAANLMGDIRIWEVETGRLAASWITPDFTCWGVIKSHHYVGGIFDMVFSPDGRELTVCGMGPMLDPMAANGKQTWQRFAWQETTPRKTAEIRDSEAGHGLMEALRFHPGGRLFVMAGRLAQGTWNTALFDSASGALLHAADTGMRVTEAVWLNGGAQLALGGATSQERKKQGKLPEFGRIKLYDLLHV